MGTRITLAALCGLLCLALTSGQCQTGGKLYNSKCYYLKDTAASQDTAKANCEKDYTQGSLASVENSGIQTFLRGELGKETRAVWRQVWVGGTLQRIAWHWIRDMEILYAQGCFRDTETKPMLTGHVTKGRDVTLSSCVKTCQDKNYAYAGVKFETSAKTTVVCRCGDNYPRDTLEVVSCPANNCPTDSSQKCGGFDIQRLYYVKAANKVDLWTPNQPNEAAAGQYCGYMEGVDSAFTFGDEKCDNPYYYVCQLPNKEFKTCSDADYYYSNDTSTCYYFSTSVSGSFSAAKTACVNIGGYLAQVNNQASFTFVRTFLIAQSVGQARIWIGLHSTDWAWSGDKMISYTSWGKSQPKYGGKCIYMNGDESYTWADDNCDKNYAYICQGASSSTLKPTASVATTTQNPTTVTATQPTQKPTTKTPTQPPTQPSTQPPTQPPTGNPTQTQRPTQTVTNQPTGTTSGGSGTTMGGTTSGGGSGTTSSGSGQGTTSSSGGNNDGRGGTDMPSTSAEPTMMLSTGVIVAIAVASIAVFVAFIRLLVYCATRRNRRDSYTGNKGEENIGYEHDDRKANHGDHALYAEVDRAPKTGNQSPDANGPNMLYAY